MDSGSPARSGFGERRSLSNATIYGRFVGPKQGAGKNNRGPWFAQRLRGAGVGVFPVGRALWETGIVKDGDSMLKSFLARKPIGGEHEQGLRRTLTAGDLLFLGVGATVGAGLFSVTGIVAADYAGPAVVISLVVAAVACMLTGLCYGEMAGMVPSAGSAYAYAYAALGELAAWIIGWDLLMEYAIGAGTVASSWSSYLRSLLRGWGLTLPDVISKVPSAGGIMDLPAIVILVALSVLLIAGVSESARVNAAMVVLKVGVILVVIGLGAFYVTSANYHPFLPANTGSFGHFGWSGVLRGAGVIFFAYLGFDAVSTVAGEVKEPQRSVPVGIIGSIAICAVLYVAFAIVLTGLVSYKDTRGDASPVATAIERTPYFWLQVTVKLGVMLGFTSVLLVGLLGQGRVMFAMARDGMLPAVLGRVHPTRKTPWAAHVMMLSLDVILAGFVPVETLSRLTSVGTLLAFAIVCGGVLVLRVRDPQRPRPFRVPLYPLVPVMGIASCLFMMAFLPPETWTRLGLWLVLGLGVYVFYSHRRAAAARAAQGEAQG
jgi:APA family basic amino acid/polyamine antiporter